MGPYRYSGLDRLLLILLVAGIALRFVQLGAKEFWHDEAYTLFNAAGLTPYGQEREYAFTHADLETRNTASGVVQACLRNDGGNGILHAMLMHGWLAMAPNSTAWLRMPSAVLGLGAILLTMAMVRDLFGDRRTSLLAGTLAAWNTLLLQGSMDLRGYTLATVLALGSTWLLCRILLDRKGRWNYTFYAAFALMGLLVHYTTLYVLLAHGIMAVLYARGWSKWARLAACAAVVAVGMLAWMANGGTEGYAVLAARNAQYTAQAEANPEINTFFQATRPATLVEGVAVQALWSSGNGLQYAGPQLRWIMLMLALPAWLLVLGWRKAANRGQRALLLAFTCLALMPMAYASVLAIGSGHTVPFFPRYALFTMPFWCALLAWGAIPRAQQPASLLLRTGPLAGTVVLGTAIGSVVLFLQPASRNIIGPNRYARHELLIEGALQATQRCAPALVHGSHTASYLLNLMSWNEAWNDLPQRVDPEADHYSTIVAQPTCSYPAVVIVANDSLFPRSEPKDPTDDIVWSTK